MVPNFNGGGYSPVTPNNGNPNTVYNQAKAGDGVTSERYLPAFEQPLGGGFNDNSAGPDRPVFVGEAYPTTATPASVPAFQQDMAKPRVQFVAPTFDRPAARNPYVAYAEEGNNQVSLGNYNNMSRSPYSLTLEQPPEPTGRLDVNTMYADSLRNLLGELTSLQRPINTIPLPGVGGGTQPGGTIPGTGPTNPTQPGNSTAPGGQGGRGATTVPTVGATTQDGFTPVNRWAVNPGSRQPAAGTGSNLPVFSNNNPMIRGNGGNGTGWTTQLADSVRSAFAGLGNELREGLPGSGVSENANGFWRTIGAAADVLLAPGASQAVEWLRRRSNGMIDIEIADIARTDPERGVRDILLEATRQLGDEAIATIEATRAGRPVSPDAQASVETLRSQLQSLGFPTNIEDMSRSDMANLINRINTANMIYNPAAREIPGSNQRSVGSSYTGPRGMTSRLRGFRMAGQGASGTMGAANRLEEEAVARWRQWVDSQVR